jgi:hypothetical protein
MERYSQNLLRSLLSLVVPYNESDLMILIWLIIKAHQILILIASFFQVALRILTSMQNKK